MPLKDFSIVLELDYFTPPVMRDLRYYENAVKSGVMPYATIAT